MLEIGCEYKKSELTQIFGSKSNQAISRKLDRYGVKFSVAGRGEQAVYKIRQMDDKFKIFAITELGFDANTDFQKLRNFYFYFFNDEEFQTLPDEMKEARMRENNRDISRQTIAKYLDRLVEHNYIAYLGGDDFVYYFAHKGKRRTVEKSEYSRAWREYWSDKESGMDYYTAIYNMIVHYGGVARKQAVPTVNAIYGKKIDEMLPYIEQSIENEIVHELYAEEPELGEEILKQMLPDDADWDEDIEKDGEM